MKMWKVYDNNNGQRTHFDQKSSLKPSAQVSEKLLSIARYIFVLLFVIIPFSRKRKSSLNWNFIYSRNDETDSVKYVENMKMGDLSRHS